MPQKNSNRLSFMLSAVLIFCLVNTAGALEIVRDGKAAATIVVASDAEKDLKNAAKILHDCLAESSGADLNIANTAPQTGNLIYIGPGPWVKEFKVKQKDLDNDGFEILFPDARSILILGPTKWGTEFGIYEFLERYVGVRWLIPGPDGTHIPKHATIDVPAVNVRQEPAFLMRLFSGFSGGQRPWLRTARMPARRRQVEYSHALARLLPFKVYGKTHPEFYPLLNGKRWEPGEGYRQICFSAPGIAEEAAKVIIKRFDENPSIRTASFGVNDNDHSEKSWCQCEACKAKYIGKNNSLGGPDCSDIYYEWCGKVMDMVLKKYPDTLFGCIAYNNVLEPPSKVKMPTRLIPFICMDRMQWVDPKRREAGHILQKRWHKASPVIGWYNYIYGRVYHVPRVYFHRMADNYRFAKANGTRYCYAEAAPPRDSNWGEGPKLYLASRLLWNPDLDVDALLRDWYTAFAGKDAADDLAKYYQHWEDFWTRRVLKTPWFGDTSSPDYHLVQYLNFTRNGYLDIISFEEMAECRHLLESALSKTRTKKQRARVQLLLNAFAESESALFFSKLDNAKSPEKTISDILQKDITPALKLKAKDLLDVYQGRAKLLSANPSFEKGADGKPDGWELRLVPSQRTGTIEWIDDPAKAHSGKRCIMVKGMKRGGPIQEISISPGKYVIMLSYKTFGLSIGRVPYQIFAKINLKDADKKNLRSESFTIIPTTDKWKTFALFFDVPDKIESNEVKFADFGLSMSNETECEDTYCDDVGVYKLPQTKPEEGVK
jgi:hypothetical protein